MATGGFGHVLGRSSRKLGAGEITKTSLRCRNRSTFGWALQHDGTAIDDNAIAEGLGLRFPAVPAIPAPIASAADRL